MRKAGTRDRSGEGSTMPKNISQPEDNLTDCGFAEVGTSEIIWEALSSLV